jgi:hypothetical protein
MTVQLLEGKYGGHEERDKGGAWNGIGVSSFAF